VRERSVRALSCDDYDGEDASGPAQMKQALARSRSFLTEPA
jgi:hypothetical protein